MVALLSVTALTREYFYTTAGFGLGMSIVAALLVWRAARSPAQAFLALTLMSLSRAYADYSTSGLENPLTHVLVAASFLAARRDSGPVLAFRVTGIAALLACNRMDTALLVLPLVVDSVRRAPARAALRPVVLATLPFVAWEAFAIFYYGFPFPNSAYAKLGTGISSPELAQQGLRYF